MVYSILLTKKCTMEEFFCDLAKVFDCVNHEILLAKVHFYGIPGESWRFVQVLLNFCSGPIELTEHRKFK